MDAPNAGVKFKGLHRATIRSDDSPITSSQLQDAQPAICRICRGEGTAEEPLFYPCKCSGSIKYVHQDCLMEWLSHSQKKYCELCKTSFRFTKLYAPDMPQSLPVHVVVGHMAKYLFRNVLVWLRAGMALSVWLCWLPYFMRSVWSFMFWVSDEGLGSSTVIPRVNNNHVPYNLTSPELAMATCPASPLFAPNATSAATAENVLHSLSSQDVSEFVIRIILGSLGVLSVSGASSPPDTLNISATNSTQLAAIAPPSLLGEVAFLNNLTRNATLNRAVISVLEGQIITVLVIICFILVILVRDYVVQQQPEINMRAAFAAPDNVVQPQEHLDFQAGAGDERRAPDDSDDETLDDGELQPAPAVAVVPADIGETAEFDHVHHALAAQGWPESLQDQRRILEASGMRVPEPNLPASSSNTVEESASVNDYLRIYRQADGDAEKILQIIEKEGLQDKLSYWVRVTRRTTGLDASEYLAQFPRTPPEMDAAGPSTNIFTPSSSDEDIAGPSNEPISDRDKGKGRESSPSPSKLEAEAELSQHASFSPSRPRSVSDGPQRLEGLHPLANHSWSWGALDEPSSATLQQREVPESSEVQQGLTGRADEEPTTVRPDENDDHDAMFRSVDDTYERTMHPMLEEAVDTQPTQHEEPNGPNNPTQAARLGDEEPNGFVNRVTDFMWGDLADHPPVQAEEAAAEDDAEDGEWVDIDVADHIEDDPNDVPEDAGAAEGLDPDAIEDLEDFEGVMELIGMRGPVVGLFQNAVFCAVLVSVTIFVCIFLPYNIGRVSVWVLAHPMRLVRLLFELSKLVQDATIFATGFVSWCTLNIIDIFTNFIGGGLASQIVAARKASWAVWTKAGSKVMECIIVDFPLSATEMQNFSAVSHGALLTVKAQIGAVFATAADILELLSGGFGLLKQVTPELVVSVCKTSWTTVLSISAWLTNPSSWVIDLGEPEPSAPINHELAYWSGLDRFWAILAGYFTVFFIGAMYLKRGSPFSRGDIMQAWEAGIIDTLHQASGIMKVIMIISIEMLIFPLYCGLLLDAALLPLFANATFKSRMLFTYNYPLTSVFVHWFVGTGYMFHFALFVSMCRKIMRPGVLCKFSIDFSPACVLILADFIRDPDDPEFHPVRDVLERNLTTQLRKILFSAMVYGALVIVCLGGVVWGLSFTLPNVLPIHYSSNEPVLEFPVDLLFYNFLMPLAVNFFKPSDGLHVMYTWWFRKCARGLRLTSFLFGERRIDEEGSLQLTEGSPYQSLPWYKTLCLELDDKNNVIPKTWQDTFEGGNARPVPPLPEEEMTRLRHKKAKLRDNGQLEESGRFVRAPASDRVKIPKGKKVFLTVTERDRRRDGLPDNDIYASDQYQVVYVPPNFRARVFLFILFIWLFAAFTGVGFTIIPLTLGRRIFKQLIPTHIKTNDIYAFSIGIYLLGTLAYSAFHMRSLVEKVRGWTVDVQKSIAEGHAVHRMASGAKHASKLVYAYFFLLVVFPLLVSAFMELYLIIPLHTYMYPPTTSSETSGAEVSRHTIRVIQAWVLGLLYLKLGARVITSLFHDTRLATAVGAVLRRGWLYPDVGVLTRAFVLPSMAVSAAAILGPPAITGFLMKYNILVGPQPGVSEAGEAARVAIIYRQSYPVAATVALLIRHAIGLVKIFRGWTSRVRDEAYLIGERLHNFGAAAAGARRVRGAWRAGGGRL